MKSTQGHYSQNPEQTGQLSDKKRTRSSVRRETGSNCDSVTFKNTSRSPATAKRPEAETSMPQSANVKARKLAVDDRTSPLNCRTTTAKEPESVTRSEVQSFNQHQGRASAAKMRAHSRQQRCYISDRMQEKSSDRHDSAWKGAKEETQRGGSRSQSKDTGMTHQEKPTKFEITQDFPDLTKEPAIKPQASPSSKTNRSGEPNLFDGAPTSTAKQGTTDLHIKTGQNASPSDGDSRSANDLQVSECPFLLRGDSLNMDRHETLATPAFVNPTKFKAIFSSEHDVSEGAGIEPTPVQKQAERPSDSVNRSVLGPQATPDTQHDNSQKVERPNRRQSKRIAAQRVSQAASSERGQTSLINSQVSKRRRLDESLSYGLAPTPDRQQPQSTSKFSSALLQQYECTPDEVKGAVSPPDSEINFARASAENRRMTKLSAKQREILQRSLEQSTGEVLNQIQQVQIKTGDLTPQANIQNSSSQDLKENAPPTNTMSFAGTSLTSSIIGMQYDEAQKNLIRHQMLNPHLYKRGPTKYQKQSVNVLNSSKHKAKGHWTAQEDKLLTEAVRKHSGKNWKKIAESLEGRTDVQCLHRWQKVLNPTLVKGPWTDIEDRLLLHLVNIDGPAKWTQIANHLPGRIGKQCRERWHNHLNPMIKRTMTWSTEEEWILFLQNRDKNNKWADIASILEGRTDNSIKNHWNSSMKRRLLVYQNKFEKQLKERLAARKLSYAGCERVEVDDNGEHRITEKERRAGVRRLPKAYIAMMIDLEQELLSEKTKILKEQNRKHYVTKCAELLEKAETDSFCLAAATIMLNSPCGYLKELRQKYARLLVKNPSAFSNHASKEVDMEQFDRTIADIVNSPVASKNPTASSVSNDISPPAPVSQQPPSLPATGTTNKENQAKIANGPQRQFGRPMTFQQWSGHHQHQHQKIEPQAEKSATTTPNAELKPPVSAQKEKSPIHSGKGRKAFPYGMVNNSLRKSETPISSAEKNKTPGIPNTYIGAFLVADSNGMKPQSSGSGGQGPQEPLYMPGQNLFAGDSPRCGHGSSASDLMPEEPSAIMGRRGVRAASGVTKFDLSSTHAKLEGCDQETRMRPKHDDRTMIGEEERPMRAQSISDLATMTNIPPPLAGQMDFDGQQDRRMIVQGQMVPFAGMRGPFYAQMAGPHCGLFIMQPVTSMPCNFPQWPPQSHENQGNTRHTDGKK